MVWRLRDVNKEQRHQVMGAAFRAHCDALRAYKKRHGFAMPSGMRHTDINAQLQKAVDAAMAEDDGGDHEQEEP